MISFVMRHLTTTAVAASITCLAVVAGWAPSNALAAFPGQNGKIAFTSDREGDLEIYVMNADGSVQTRLTNNTAFDFRPAWSPDGQRIAFISTRDGNNEIYVMNADGSAPTRLTNNASGDFFPAWSPDGQKIAFHSSRDSNSEIYVMNADGSGQTRLTNNAASESSPAWSPDGQKIAFRSTRDGNSEVYVMNADGTAPTRLTNNAASDDEPAWSPDGQKIAFDSSRDGNNEIYVMNADGSGPTRLTSNAALDIGVDWQPSPCIQVGLPCAQGTFTETAPGSGIFETTSKSWVGGFELVPRPGASLFVNTVSPALVPSGGVVDVVFAGFDVPIPLGAIPLTTQDATIEIGTPGTLSKILEIPVEAQAKLSWTGCAPGGQSCTSSTYEQNIKLAELSLGVGQLTAPEGGATAEGKLKATLKNGTGFVLDSGELSISALDITPRALRVPRTLRLRDLLLKFERKANAAGELKPFWTGRAGIGLPLARGDLDLIGTGFVFDGSIAGGGLQVEGINKQVLGPLFLQKVGGDLLFSPSYGMDLRIGATVGPSLQGVKLISLDGSLQGGSLVTGCEGGPDPAKLEAVVKLPALAAVAETNITQRACIFPGTGTAEAAIEGTLEGEVDVLDGTLGYKGTQVGFVSESGASYEGTILLTLPALPDLEGSAILSTAGIAACADLSFFEGGFGYRFGTPAPLPFAGCDLGLFRVPRPASATGRSEASVARAGGGAIDVPKGLPHAGFAVEGKTGAPLVRVTGPGFKAQSPADGSGLQTKQVVIVPVAAESKTYVIVNDPKAGRWKVDSLEKSNPLAEVSFAEGLAKPKIKAKVSKLKKKKGKGKGGKDRAKGSKGKLQLTYKLRRIPGQKVTFTERGPGIARVLGKAKGTKGKIVFKPTASDDPARTIEAEVVQNGLPREVLTVARFGAGAG